MRKTVLIAGLAAALPVSALAGDNNSVELLQVSTGGLGNTLMIDQSEANNSLVAGDPSGLSPALQYGTDNEAMLTLTDDGGTAVLRQGAVVGEQDALFEQFVGNLSEEAFERVPNLSERLQNAVVGPATGNVAEALVSGQGGLGVIQQLGNGNTAELEVSSLNADLPAEGRIGQFGSGNFANLSVEGGNVSGELVQIGSNNSNSLQVRGQDSSVSYTQIGSNNVNPDPSGVQVFTNQSVSITTTSF